MGEGICEQWRPSFASSRSAESTRVATSCMTVLSAWQRVLSSMALRRHRTAAGRLQLLPTDAHRERQFAQCTRP
jgi:hypothetical protein